MIAAETPPFQPTKQRMAHFEKGGDDGEMDALDERQQAGIAFQVAAELVKSAKAFFRLVNKYRIWLVVGEQQWIINVQDGKTTLAKLLAKEHILITIMQEAFIERMTKHHLAFGHEIGRPKTAVRMLGTLLCSVLWSTVQFVSIAQVLLPLLPVSTYGNATIHHVAIRSLNVAFQKLGIRHLHVTVQEQQPLKTALLCQKVAYSRATDINLPADETAGRQSTDSTVRSNSFLLCRPIIGHDDFILYAHICGLPLEFLHQRQTTVIIDWYQY